VPLLCFPTQHCQQKQLLQQLGLPHLGNEHFVTPQQLGHEHFVQHNDPKQLGNLRKQQPFMQLGLQQHLGQLMDQETFMQSLQQLEQSGHLTLQHFILQHVLQVEQVFDFDSFALCLIFLRRFSVVMFSIS